MFATLFKRAEASVDNAIGDLGNRVLITIPFLVALGFAASSLSLMLNRTYGPEAGNMILAGAFCTLGFMIAIVVKVRSQSAANLAAETSAAREEVAEATETPSLLDDESFMAIVSSAVPILVPSLLRTGMKNWPVLLAAAIALYVFSQSDEAMKNSARPAPAE